MDDLVAKGWEIEFVAANPDAACAEIERSVPLPYREGIKSVIRALETDRAVELHAAGDFNSMLVIQTRAVDLIQR
jgi:hypothetical protein